MTLLSDQLSDNCLWYLVHCQPRKEMFAANNLKSQLGLSIFFPEVKVRSRKETRWVPFFPGYIFVKTDLQKVSLSRINTMPGVIHLVAFGGDPQPVPRQVIEAITMRLEQLNSSDRALHNFAPGDFVRVKHGPLQDLDMIFLGSSAPGQRVLVLLRLLGRVKEVHVDVELLEKVPNKPHIQPDAHLIHEKRIQRIG